jgi:hypothetical protein
MALSTMIYTIYSWSLGSTRERDHTKINAGNVCVWVCVCVDAVISTRAKKKKSKDRDRECAV